MLEGWSSEIVLGWSPTQDRRQKKHAQTREEIAKSWQKKQEWDWTADILDISVTVHVTSIITPFIFGGDRTRNKTERSRPADRRPFPIYLSFIINATFKPKRLC